MKQWNAAAAAVPIAMPSGVARSGDDVRAVASLALDRTRSSATLVEELRARDAMALDCVRLDGDGAMGAASPLVARRRLTGCSIASVETRRLKGASEQVACGEEELKR